MITHQLNSKKVMEHLLMLIVLAIAVTSCSNEENEMVKFGNKDSDIVVYAENFGKMHNECLDYCYEQLVSVKLRSKKTFTSEYWITKHSYWMDLKMQSIDQFTTTKAAAWVVADCYWGWFGTVSSGGNGLVGAGAAAVASACAAL